MEIKNGSIFDNQTIKKYGGSESRGTHICRVNADKMGAGMELVNGKLKRDGEGPAAKGTPHADKWGHMLDDDGDLIGPHGFKMELEHHPIRIDAAGHVMIETCKTIRIERSFVTVDSHGHLHDESGHTFWMEHEHAVDYWGQKHEVTIDTTFGEGAKPEGGKCNVHSPDKKIEDEIAKAKAE